MLSRLPIPRRWVLLMTLGPLIQAIKRLSTE